MISQAGGALEIVRMSSGHVAGVLALLSAIKEEGSLRWFDPHPATRDYLEAKCTPGCADLYYVMVLDSSVLGYGLLRGWEEGYEIPSLGIAIHPRHRGRGLAQALMTFLHAAARQRSASRVRLRVYPDNHTAIALYRSLGYLFDEPADQKAGGPLTGFKQLT